MTRRGQTGRVISLSVLRPMSVSFDTGEHGGMWMLKVGVGLGREGASWAATSGLGEDSLEREGALGSFSMVATAIYTKVRQRLGG